MSKILVLFFLFIFIFSSGIVFADGKEPTNEELLEEIRALKAKILELETRLIKQEQRMKKAEAQTDKIQNKFEHIDTHRLHTKQVPAFVGDGFKIGAGATMIVQGTDEINADTVTKNDAVTDATYSVDLEIEKEFNNYGKTFVHLEAGKGNGVEDELKVFSNVNRDVDNDENVRVTEVWYEHYFNDFAILTFGKLDSTVYFDSNAYANNETSQFLGRIFRNSPVIEFPNNTGGIRFSLAPSEIIELDFGYFDADGDWEDIFEEAFLISQVNIRPNLFNRNGNYRLLGWFSDKHHTKWEDSTQDQEGTYGFGVSFDQDLTDNLVMFVRYGWQNPDVYLNGESYSLDHSWSTGLQLSGTLWGRDRDIWALAVGQIFPSDKYKDSNSILNATAEGHFETYYSFKVNDHLTISPDIQIIWNPYGDDATTEDQTISVYGMRAQVDF
jgi:carbohydrate-selective porin OprB